MPLSSQPGEEEYAMVVAKVQRCGMGWRGVVTLAGAMLLGCSAGTAQAQLQLQPVRLGAGLDDLRDWTRSLMVNDLVYQSRPWGPRDVPWNGNAPLDANGWPTDDAGIILACCQAPGTLTGVYTITFEAAAIPTVDFISTDGQVISSTRDPGTGIVTIQIQIAPTAIQIFLGFIGTQGGMRNFKCLAPWNVQGTLFNPTFVQHIDRFHILRFMDTHLTNNNRTAIWANRTPPNAQRWRQQTGMPYEVAIQLCNQVGADYWVNIPHNANDEYVTNLATLIRDNLNPNLKVYVEMSNEVWNTIYRQATDNRAAAQAEVGANPSSNLAYDGTTNTAVWGWRRYARRTMQMGQIFTQVFGQGSFGTRVRPILSGQVVNDSQYLNMLRYLDIHYGNPNTYIWALGVSPYFIAWHLDGLYPGTLTVDQLIAGLDQGRLDWYNSIQYERYSTYSAWYGLNPMVGYEGGVDTRGTLNAETKALAHADPRMQGLCFNFMQDWQKRGGGDFAWYKAGAGEWAGEWGGYFLTQRMDELNTPKIQAMDQVLATPRVPADAGVLLPGVIEGRRHAQRPSNWQTSNLPAPTTIGPGQWYDYLVRVEQPGTYFVGIVASSWETDSGLALAINRQDLGALPLLPRTGGDLNTNFQTFTGLSVTLPAGVSTLRVTSTRPGGFHLQSIIVSSSRLCDDIDFNNDGITSDPTDIEAFLSVYSGGPCIPAGASCSDVDFNNDGLEQDPTDIEAFLSIYSGGPCL